MPVRCPRHHLPIGTFLITVLILNGFFGLRPAVTRVQAQNRTIIMNADRPNVRTLEQAHYLRIANLEASPAPNPTLPAGLLGWWRGEGNSLDSAGANHGTPFGNVTFTAGKVGPAFNFHGWREGVRTNSRVYDMSGGTVSLWFNWDGTQATHSANVMIGTSMGFPRVSPVFDIDTGFLLWEFGNLFRNGTKPR